MPLRILLLSIACLDENGHSSCPPSARSRRQATRQVGDCARKTCTFSSPLASDAEHLIYDRAEPGSGATALRLTTLELLERLAALVPPPRVHRHRCYGVLARMRRYRVQ
jgi:hypothetical protein